MLLYYHQDPLGNFGDDLNPWLWSRLLPGWFSGDLAHEPKRRAAGPIAEPLFVGIGTLLNQNVPEGPPKIVFGAGAGYGPGPRLDASWEFFCVRGPDTASALGLDPALAVTDPAVLVRVVPPAPNGAAVRRMAYMPHCSSARNANWGSLCEDLGIGFIDPHEPVDAVLSGVRSTEVLVTEAMHGAIVADALRIPWIAVSSSPAILGSKWVDWCKSLGLEYRPERLPAVWKTRPDGGAVARLRPRIKMSLAKLALRRVLASGAPVLSKRDRLERVTDELLARLERFKQRHPRPPEPQAGAGTIRL